VLHAGVNVIIDNQRLKTVQGRTGGLYLSYDVDAVTIICHHFADRTNLAANSSQSGVGFALCFVSHGVLSLRLYPAGVYKAVNDIPLWGIESMHYGHGGRH
jgi:hypothetical protein